MMLRCTILYLVLVTDVVVASLFAPSRKTEQDADGCTARRGLTASDSPSTSPNASPSLSSPLPIDYEHVVSRVDSQVCPSHNNTIPTLNTVTNRELIIGCFGFEEYLSPNFETIFILNEDYVRGWGIDTLVRDATCEQSLGAHVFLLDNYGGEVLGRRLAVDFILREVKDRHDIQFLNHMNCDVRTLPKEHVNYRTMRQSVEKMTQDFIVARAQREPQTYPDIDFPSFPLVTTGNPDSSWHSRGILTMSPVLFEDFFNMSELPLDVHGSDTCFWRAMGGLDGRPSRFGNYPWLCNTPRFVENHWLMFDFGKLTSPAVKAQYLDSFKNAGIVSYPSDTRLTPSITVRNNLTNVLNFDVHAHQNFCHQSDCMDHYPEEVDKDWIRVVNWLHNAEQRNPSDYYDTWNEIHDHVMETPYLGLSMLGFTFRQCFRDSPWFPVGLNGPAKPLDSCDLCNQFVTALLKSLGYYYFDEDDDNMYFRLEGVFPMNLFVRVDTSGAVAPNDSWEFMQLTTKDGVRRRYIALGNFTTPNMRVLPPAERTLSVPKKSWIYALQKPSGLKRRRYIHTRGRYNEGDRQPCGPPDQNPNLACGYLESSDFDFEEI